MKLTVPYPPARQGRVVLWGFLSSMPFGGMTWQVLHHLVGLRRLGYDVWYAEDSERPGLSPETYEPTDDYAANARYLAHHMELIGLGDRWILRPPGSTRSFGARDVAGLEQLYREADVVLNLCGAQEPIPAFSSIGCLVYLQTDPVSDQVRVASGDEQKIQELDAYHHLYTYGLNIGSLECPVPVHGYDWKPTRPPVVLDWWATDRAPGADAKLTTVAKWRHTEKDVVWQGEQWRWSKHSEFRRFLRVAETAPLPLELAVSAITPEEIGELRRHGWRTIPSSRVKLPRDYRRYIRSSLGEFTAAKEQYVRTRSGWFSDRSVCYLAAGRPVVMQDTGLGKTLPTGEGLLLFDSDEEALAAIEDVARDYQRHATAASGLAREHFAAERVLGQLMAEIGLPPNAAVRTTRPTDGARGERGPNRDGLPGEAAVAGGHILPADAVLASRLSSILEPALATASVQIVSRKPRSVGTFPKEIVTCRTSSGDEVRIFCKYGFGHVVSGHGHRGGVPHEANVYRRVLAASGLSVAHFYGSYADPADGAEWLVVEYLEDSRRLHKCSDPDALPNAARWIGRFHRLAETSPDAAESRSFLPSYDRTYYEGWGERLANFVRSSTELPGWLPRLTDAYRSRTRLLLVHPTIVHGEYYPKNILVRHGEIYPVDWESAAVAAGEIDLASLVDGWPDETVVQCVNAYRESRWPAGAPPEFASSFETARLYVHFRWLGDTSDRTPAQSPRFEQLEAIGERLGVL